MIDQIIEGPKKEIVEFLNSKYNLKVDTILGSNNFLNSSIMSLISLKFWDEAFKYDSKVYFDEIVSNFNQMTILALLGFKVPALILLRRCLENIVVFIYYKDHPVEFLKKEMDVSKRNFDKVEDLLNYINDFPYNAFLNDIDLNQLKFLIQDLKKDWQENYKLLSNYVHSSNTKYLDLHSFLSDIATNVQLLDEVLGFSKSIISYIHAICLIFFQTEYSTLNPMAKTMIRNSITTESYKRKLITCFGEI
ncbi:hypothetical protein [Larkinella soli]|uniref:hypothetical protein n=1 Tax=Larkinella soli TaxID=1770527 RepID=UPI000FFC3DE2|nr:hypothetical protein [Larkinella soli]